MPAVRRHQNHGACAAIRENKNEMMGAAMTPVCGLEAPEVLERRARARALCISPRAKLFGNSCSQDTSLKELIHTSGTNCFLKKWRKAFLLKDTWRTQTCLNVIRTGLYIGREVRKPPNVAPVRIKLADETVLFSPYIRRRWKHPAWALLSVRAFLPRIGCGSRRTGAVHFALITP